MARRREGSRPPARRARRASCRAGWWLLAHALRCARCAKEVGRDGVPACAAAVAPALLRRRAQSQPSPRRAARGCGGGRGDLAVSLACALGARGRRRARSSRSRPRRASSARTSRHGGPPSTAGRCSRRASPRCSRPTPRLARALVRARARAVPRQAAVALARQPVLRPRVPRASARTSSRSPTRATRARSARTWSGAAARSARCARARRRRALGGRALRGAVLAREGVLLAVGTVVGERLLCLPSVGPPSRSASARARRGRGRATPARNGGGGGGGAKGLVGRALARRAAVALAAVVALAAAGAGARVTVQRNAEWRTELALFESAMRVCPVVAQGALEPRVSCTCSAQARRRGARRGPARRRARAPRLLGRALQARSAACSTAPLDAIDDFEGSLASSRASPGARDLGNELMRLEQRLQRRRAPRVRRRARAASAAARRRAAAARPRSDGAARAERRRAARRRRRAIRPRPIDALLDAATRTSTTSIAQGVALARSWAARRARFRLCFSSELARACVRRPRRVLRRARAAARAATTRARVLAFERGEHCASAARSRARARAQRAAARGGRPRFARQGPACTVQPARARRAPRRPRRRARGVGGEEPTRRRRGRARDAFERGIALDRRAMHELHANLAGLLARAASTRAAAASARARSRAPDRADVLNNAAMLRGARERPATSRARRVRARARPCCCRTRTRRSTSTCAASSTRLQKELRVERAQSNRAARAGRPTLRAALGITRARARAAFPCGGRSMSGYGRALVVPQKRSPV